MRELGSIGEEVEKDLLQSRTITKNYLEVKDQSKLIFMEKNELMIKLKNN